MRVTEFMSENDCGTNIVGLIRVDANTKHAFGELPDASRPPALDEQLDDRARTFQVPHEREEMLTGSRLLVILHLRHRLSRQAKLVPCGTR